MTSTESAQTDASLWPYVLQFSVIYLAATAAAMAIIFATGWGGSGGIDIAILAASVVVPVFKFVREHRRALTRREQLRFAALAFVTSTLLWLGLTALAVSLVAGPQYVTQWASGLQYVGPGYLTVMIVVAALQCLLSFAVLYFLSGYFSRAFYRRLSRQSQA